MSPGNGGAESAKRSLRSRLGTPNRADPMVLWLAAISVLAGMTLMVATSGWVPAFIGGMAFGAGANAFVFEVI